MNRNSHRTPRPTYRVRTSAMVVGLLFAVLGGQSADAQEAAAAPKTSSGRDLLELYGLEPVKLMSFQDDQPVTPDELELVLRTLVVGRRFTLSELKRYAVTDVPWDELSAAPDEQRGELFHLRGRVKRIDRLLLTPEQQEQYEVREAFRCELQVGDEQRRAMVFALRVPEAWKIGEPLDERVSANAIFLKNAISGEAAVAPLFACTRLAWHPPGPLGDLGFDFGLLDDVENQTPLQLNDSEAFYSMLGAMGRVSASDLLRLAGANKSVESLFPTMRPENGKMVRHDPRVQPGELVALSGMVIRCIEIKIESADLRAAYGMDHYYEIEMTNVDSQGNPISFCVRDIPPGMPQGRRLTTDVRIAGFFFKTWTFKQQRDATTLEQTAEGKVKLRVAPLLIGRSPILIEPLAKGNSWLNYIAAGVFVALAVGAWFGVWWFNREDRQFSARTIDKKFAPQPGKSLDDAGIEDHDPPDFSRLP